MNRRTRIVVIVVGVITGMAVLRLAGAFQPLESLSQAVLLPSARFFSTLGSGLNRLFRGSPEDEELKERNAEIEARLVALTVDYVRLRSLEEENRSLRASAKFLDQTGYDHVPARIIARSPDPQSATLVIDKGAKDGLETGMAVVVEDGIFVGKITLLRDRVSTVTLVADERSRLAASLAGRNRLIGLVEGRGNGVARLTLVPHSEPLDPDNVIVTAGSEEKIPANLIIGLVNDVEGKATDPFKNASIEPLARMDVVSLVTVLRPAVLRPEKERRDGR